MKIEKKKIIAPLLTAIFGLFLTSNTLEAKEATVDYPGDSYCMRCHGMKTIGYQDPKTGQLVDLFIDQKSLPHSSHGEQKCESCHKGDFEEYPHDIARDKQANSCPDCHQDKPELRKYRFDKITVQFNKSVHKQKQLADFTCYTCHDLHSWQIGKVAEKTSELVARSNRGCLKCHSTTENIQGATVTISKNHSWLPATGLHMDNIRCVECHTPRPGSIIHAIEPARRAEKNCESCHSKDSILLTKLYKYRISQHERSAGFINGVVLNDTYIIGMTRHPLLDMLGVMIVGLTGLGVTAHGLGRWIAAKRRKSDENHNQH